MYFVKKKKLFAMFIVFVFGGSNLFAAEQNRMNGIQSRAATAISIQEFYNECKPHSINEDFSDCLVFSSYILIGYTSAGDNRIPVPTFPWSWSAFHYSRWDYSLYTTGENTFYNEQSSQRLGRNTLYTN